MESIRYIEVLIVFFSVLYLILGLVILVFVIRLKHGYHRPDVDTKPKDRKVLVPGRGFFSIPKTNKKNPIYNSDEVLWQKEQDDKKRG